MLENRIGPDFSMIFRHFAPISIIGLLLGCMTTGIDYIISQLFRRDDFRASRIECKRATIYNAARVRTAVYVRMRSMVRDRPRARDEVLALTQDLPHSARQFRIFHTLSAGHTPQEATRDVFRPRFD